MLLKFGSQETKYFAFFCGAEYYRLQLAAVPNIMAEFAFDYWFSREIEVSKTITAAEAAALIGERCNGQWARGKKNRYDILITNNLEAKEIPIQMAMKSL